MINSVFEFLRNDLNEKLPRDSSDGAMKDLFVYANTSKDDSLSFDSDSVSMMLIRMEEETATRQPDPYTRVSAMGLHQRIAPEIKMNLWVLLVARFPNDYARALKHISEVISYFQKHRVFNNENSPGLSDEISQLVMELVTPTFSEANQIWGLLRAAYQPSVLYKIKMITFEDDDGTLLTPISEIIQTTTQKTNQ
jgi:hypothetical protein